MIGRKSSKCTSGVATQQRGGSPEYDEIPTPESDSQNDVPTSECCLCCSAEFPLRTEALSIIATLQKQVGCFNHRVVTMVADKLKRQ